MNCLPVSDATLGRTGDRAISINYAFKVHDALARHRLAVSLSGKPFSYLVIGGYAGGLFSRYKFTSDINWIKKNSINPPAFDMLPDSMAQYFWDCDFSALDIQQHRRFIAERILVYGNSSALNWLLDEISEAELRDIVQNGKNLDAKTRNFWQLKLSMMS